jgi:aryl-alcohol dehydrogenase-like predicted oxidoreductase
MKVEYRRLAGTEINVSALCLGTMTFGEQNTESEAHSQLDAALDSGVNFIDTAELYPVPPRAETQGLTESYIGSWLHRRKRRSDVVLATKVAGRADWTPHLRGGKARLDRSNIRTALDASLKRLRTDYVDLYQVHWPDRPANYFGELGYRHPDTDQGAPIAETLEALAELVAEGKVRHIGVSNETPWGVSRYLHLSETLGAPRIVSIQNPYSLLNRSFEVGLAEFSHREGVGLLAYSPLAFGVLSGKYLDGKRPAGARLTLFDRFTRYSNPESEQATRAYVDLARQHGVDPAQMALAFVTGQPFVTSNIIGATTSEQLRANLDSADLVLSAELRDGIEAIHRRQPNPAP